MGEAGKKRKNKDDAPPAKAGKKQTKVVEVTPPVPEEPKKKKSADKKTKGSSPGAVVKKSPPPPAAEEKFDDVEGAATSKLDVSLLGRTVKALLTHVARESGGLLDDAAPVHVLIGSTHMPKPVGKAKQTKPVSLPLPHPFVSLDTAEICLITKDPQREYKDKLAAQGVKVSRVIGVTKLKKKFHTYESKRELIKTYDTFLADERILPMLPPLLGKVFFEKKRTPMAVDLKKRDLKNQIEKAACGAMYRHAVGTSNSIQLATTAQTPKEIVANIVSGVEQVVNRLPGKWHNVQNLQLRTTNSVALPFYNALPNVVEK